MEINGSVQGNIRSTTDIEISETGSYKGDASMANLVLSGTADGTVDCEDLTKLTSTGNMVGNLSASRLITEEGSNFGGNLQLVSAKAQQLAKDLEGLEDFEQPQEAPAPEGGEPELPEENAGAVNDIDSFFQEAEAFFEGQNQDQP